MLTRDAVRAFLREILKLGAGLPITVCNLEEWADKETDRFFREVVEPKWDAVKQE